MALNGVSPVSLPLYSTTPRRRGEAGEPVSAGQSEGASRAGSVTSPLSTTRPGRTIDGELLGRDRLAQGDAALNGEVLLRRSRAAPSGAPGPLSSQAALASYRSHEGNGTAAKGMREYRIDVFV